MRASPAPLLVLLATLGACGGVAPARVLPAEDPVSMFVVIQHAGVCSVAPEHTPTLQVARLAPASLASARAWQPCRQRPPQQRPSFQVCGEPLAA